MALSPAGLVVSAQFAGEMMGQAAPPQEPLSLWYRRPATQWVEALPIGNGRLGAMIFGGIDNERIQLNEDTVWCGGPYDSGNPELLKALPETRRLIFQGKYAEAAKLIGGKLLANPIRRVPYEVVGDLYLRFAGQARVENYRRDLNLDSAIATVSYTAGGVKYTREAFSSPVDQVIVIRLTADKPGQIAFAAGLRSPQSVTVETEGSDTLVMRGSNAGWNASTGAIKFQARVRVLAIGGKTTAKDREVSVTGADSAMLLVAAATNYKSYDDLSGDPELLAKNCLAAAEKKTFDGLRRDHVAEHRRLFRRVALDLGTTPAAACPTDERIKHYTATSDPQLATLYFQYGRYLLISCSRPGGQPANLQGLWNESMGPHVGEQLHHRRQYRNELLARRADEPRRVHGAIDRDGVGPDAIPARASRRSIGGARLGGPRHQRSVAGRGAARATAGGLPGPWAGRGSCRTCGTITSTTPIRSSWPGSIPP